MPVSLLPKLAQLFGVAGDELLGLNSGAGKRGSSSRSSASTALPKAKQKLVMEMLEGVLMQTGRKMR